MESKRLPKIMFIEMMHQYKELDKKEGKGNSNWLYTYSNLLNSYGSSVEDMQIIFAQKNVAALSSFLLRVSTNLTNNELQKAQVSRSYGYYKSPFISHSVPEYSLTTWPLFLKRLNAALRNQSEWIKLSKDKILRLYKYETCPLCNVSDGYNMYHILTQCTMLNPYKKQVFPALLTYPEDGYVHSFANLSLNQLKKIHSLLCIHVSQVDLTL